MFYFNSKIFDKVVKKFITKQRRKTLSHLHSFYIAVKLLSINILLIAIPLLLFMLVVKIEKIYNFPETIGWIILPLYFLSLPLTLLLYNLISYMIKPYRKYLCKIHKVNNLPSFSEANKELITALIYLSPLLILAVFMGIFLSYKNYSNEIIGLLTIFLSIFSVILFLKKYQN